jgi:prepilin-type N-terminal cleavage/methylation domain-containing protein
MGASRGFSLVELLSVTVILGILASMIMLLYSNNADRVEALRIAGELDSVKSATIAYSADNRRRNKDPLESLTGDISSTIASYLDKRIDRETVLIKDSSSMEFYVAFRNFPAGSGLKKQLDKLVSKGNGFEGSGSGGSYTLSLKLK